MNRGDDTMKGPPDAHRHNLSASSSAFSLPFSPSALPAMHECSLSSLITAKAGTQMLEVVDMRFLFPRRVLDDLHLVFLPGISGGEFGSRLLAKGRARR